MFQDNKMWIKIPSLTIFEMLFVSITEIIWQKFDVIIDNPYLT